MDVEAQSRVMARRYAQILRAGLPPLMVTKGSGNDAEDIIAGLFQRPVEDLLRERRKLGKERKRLARMTKVVKSMTQHQQAPWTVPAGRKPGESSMTALNAFWARPRSLRAPANGHAPYAGEPGKSFGGDE